MRSIILVAIREFKHRVQQRGFLIMTLALPVFMVVGALAGNLSAGDDQSMAARALEDIGSIKQGIVDRAGIVQALPPDLPADQFLEFNDAAAADQALEAGRVEAYYLIPSDYLESGEVQRISMTIPTNPPDTSAMEWVLLWNLSRTGDFDHPELLRNPEGGGGITHTDILSDTAQGSGSPVPMFAAIIILVPLFVNGSLLFQSLTQEKEGKVMEILLSSIRPRDLLIGKLFGVAGLMFLQYLIWGVMGLVVFLVAGSQLSPLLAALNFSQLEVGLVLLYAVIGFFLYAGLMAGIGALAPDMESSRAWLFVITLPMTIPIYIGASIAADPQGVVSVGLSLFPPSAPVAMLIRMAGSAVPGWQIGMSVLLLLVSVVFVLWLMARLFRAQTLLSGEPLSVPRFLEAVRSA